jgi:hypothetical protein
MKTPEAREAGQDLESNPFDTAITNLWAELNPVVGYTGGWLPELRELFVPTTASTSAGLAKISALRSQVLQSPVFVLRETALKLLDLFATQLKFPQPGDCIYDCGDGAFYISLKNTKMPAFVQIFLENASRKIDYACEEIGREQLNIVQRRQCITAADYCSQTMAILSDRQPELKPLVDRIQQKLKLWKSGVLVPGLDAADFPSMFSVIRAHSTAPEVTPGYASMLSSLYDFTSSSSDIELAALGLLNRDMPVVMVLSCEIGRDLGLPASSRVGDVWDAVSRKYAIPDQQFMSKMEGAAKVCNAFAAEFLLTIDSGDHVVLEKAPDYMLGVMTGGQDIAVDFLTANPSSYIYLAPAKNASLLTMINIMVHEYSHGYNFVKAAKLAGSPLLNLASPMQVPLTEGQAFWREWEFWAAAAKLFGKADLSEVEKLYLGLYGESPLDQSKAIRAAQFETYIWRVVRAIRALCDVQVNMGWKTFVEFLDWASDATGLTAEFLYGECFTFLRQPGYAPAYAIDGAMYGELQAEALKRGVPWRTYNTIASSMGFYPWTQCVEKLTKIGKEQ